LPAAQAPRAARRSSPCARTRTARLHGRRAAALGAARRAADAAVLQLETVRDHLRAIALDWPARTDRGRTWPGCAARRWPSRGRWRRTCAALQSFGDWLARDVLHEALPVWLARCADEAGLLAWCEREADRCAPARALRDWHTAGRALRAECVPLPVLDADAATQEARLRQLAGHLACDPRFAQWPHWRGLACENGPWTRGRHAGRARPATAWSRLAARWIELVELAAAPGEVLLAQGALPLAPGEAIAWCEMARGLLFHWIRLDAGGRVRDLRVLAPTEWNFHPAGTLARALQALEPGDAAAAALLAAAFDACVPCSVEPAP